ncbi:hypothetical protein M7784_16295 [Desulfovibrio aminophilus]|nr:hypothetical protein [Desulfovibrio aminophilus]MCM0756795.1 hypothetical protein [Desulfovibrio aminophilus]
MKRIALFLGLILAAAWTATAAGAGNEIVRELTSNGTLGPDYIPKKQEYRLDPLSDFHYSSDPFLREKKDVKKKDEKDSPVHFSFGTDERTNPVTGDRVERDRSGDGNPLDALGGKVRMDVNVLEF